MRLYNSLTNKIEEFIPLSKNRVLMYVCGITPYDTTHLGHAFLYVFFDAVRRYLKFKGYDVNFTQNLTDIDDSILEKAKTVNEDWLKLGNFWNDKFLNDLNSINILPPDNYVRATHSIPKIIEIITKLITQGFAYIKEGNVYFSVNKFPDYGKLSKFNRNQMLMIAKERGGNVEDKLKNDPLDFILWQRSMADEPSWDSPWGKGRPGWHIECSAMINQYLGDQIDIHGGGRDLIFPHHESEIAQSESFTQKSPFVKYWMHAAMVMYQGEKMSKSLGNLVMVSDLLKKYSSDAIRLLLLSHHYRAPWEYTADQMNEAEDKIKRIRECLKNITGAPSEKDLNYMFAPIDEDFNLPIVFKNLLDACEGNNTPSKLAAKKVMEVLGFEINKL